MPSIRNHFDMDISLSVPMGTLGCKASTDEAEESVDGV